MRRVVVTGMGIISPIGNSVDEVMASLHFFQGVVPPLDQDSFITLLFQVFAEVVPT